MGQWNRGSYTHTGAVRWTCTACGRGVVECRAYPSSLAVCPACGAREAGTPVVEAMEMSAVLAVEWPDMRGACIYSDDGQALSLSWTGWNRVAEALADARGQKEDR